MARGRAAGGRHEKERRGRERRWERRKIVEERSQAGRPAGERQWLKRGGRKRIAKDGQLAQFASR
eukprot:752603-Hanusia_phi.AAC.1